VVSKEQNKRIILPFIPRQYKNILKDSVLRYPQQVLVNLVFQIRSEKFFSQTAEDALLQKFLPERSGTYVDIGGGHPVKYSNTYAFYRRGWSGISVDAIEFNTNIHKILRPRDKSIHALIGEGQDFSDFYIFEPYGLSTADPDVARNVMKIKDVRLIEKVKIKSIRLDAIVPDLNPNMPSFLSIDVEGLDLMVLKTNNWSKFRPRYICVENWDSQKASGSSEVEHYLNSVNYSKVAFTGLSEIYVADEYKGVSDQ
jgi:FkbM family methyltransferase